MASRKNLTEKVQELTAWQDRPKKLQEMAIRQIRVDYELQSRVQTSPDQVKEYHDDLLNGATFPPVVLFFDGKVYWLADGFHRVAAHRKAGRQSIPALVYESSRRDAILYSVSANIKMGFRLTRDDKRKSVLMLLSDPEYFNMSNNEISRRCDVSAKTVVKYRGQFCDENHIEFKAGLSDPSEPIFVVDKRQGKGRGQYRKHVGGKLHYLGGNYETAKKRLAAILEKNDSPKTKVFDQFDVSGMRSSVDLVHALVARGISARTANSLDDSRNFVGGVISGNTYIIHVREFNVDSIFRVIGMIYMFNKKHPGVATRHIVCCKFPNGNMSGLGGWSWVLDVCSQNPNPIEFMTSAELIAALAPKSESESQVG